MYSDYRGVAQWVERVLWEHEVAGSSPVTPTKLKLETRCQKKKLKRIEGTSTSNKVTFYFDDDSNLTFGIEGDKDCTFLYSGTEHNAEAFYQLGIDDPHQLYRDLGIYVAGGDCPECKREDLDKVFDYLLKNYSVQPVEEPKKPKQPSEWDWLLD